MWLIDTSTMCLKYCTSPKDHKYAILSHTWADEEVTYQDIAKLETARQKAGFAKIEKTCEMASFQGLQYAWIDTCCINKDSSAELTEAINSMFEWYAQSEVCYAYIEDLPSCHHETLGMPTLDWLSPSAQTYRWFTRGWTLQELIAPRRLEFYDEHWGPRGEKSNLLAEISQHTGIDVDVLVDSAVLSKTPVARKMSWASGRQTTRVEDMAYCLLGIFNVNMPMIYGEGERAFIRLQEEISKESNDLSLFAWTARRSPATFFSGLLASSPAEFAGSGTVVRYRNYLDPNPEYQLTNNGVRMQTTIGRAELGKYVLNLECGISPKAVGHPFQWLGVYLFKTAFGFTRIHPEKMYVTDDTRIWAGNRSIVYIHKSLRGREEKRVSLEVQGRMFLQYHAEPYYTVQEVVSAPDALWNPQDRYFLTMEAVSQGGGGQSDMYPLFTGFKGLNISHGGLHLCSCLLVCGLFPDSQSRLQPLAVLYTDRDPSCTSILEAIRASKGGEGNAALLDQIRKFVISKHSPETEEPLTWDHVRERTVEVDQTVLTINISPNPTGAEQERVPREAAKIYTVSINIQPARRLRASH
ncbi:heterokaryon incompatibility protein-domain-containing protein [Lasiosphaeria ovina]|uniref:Heterokaryon incompatibility protein-domain-containing protein n=1 Tax=Lasiosphaeria ovina TaxID=92902 RepID=A0AAE0K3D6_9PEZI|nr:heterokaryon incompatibility protein-domain-containing protein [Lasiosphaeria ovina]